MDSDMCISKGPISELNSSTKPWKIQNIRTHIHDAGNYVRTLSLSHVIGSTKQIIWVNILIVSEFAHMNYALDGCWT